MKPTGRDVANQVVDVLQGVLVNQRTRWAALMGMGHGFEGWWKGEFALALESWCWQDRTAAEESAANRLLDLGVTVEAKLTSPSLSRVKPGAFDLLIAPWTAGRVDFDEGPAVWVEIKQRCNPPWSSAAKALYDVRADIEGCAGFDDNRVALGVLIYVSETDVDRWQPDKVTAAAVKLNFRPLSPVGCLVKNAKGDLRYRWARLFVWISP